MSHHAKARKKLYVSGAIQGRILLRITAYWILYHFVLWHTLFLASGLTQDGSYTSLSDAYARFFWKNLVLLMCAAAVFPIIFRDMLKITHRVAGPFVRFERALNTMARGEHVEPITLRKHDMVHEFLDVFNKFIEYHNRKLAQESEPDSTQSQGSQNDSRSEKALAATTH